MDRVLSTPQRQLFRGMHPVAQRHHLDVCQDLLRQGWRDPEVLAAALLHDVGKGRLSAWQRAVVVLVQQVAPALVSPPSLSRGPARGPLAWLSLQAGHAERGAVLVAGAGGSSRTVELIRRHEDRDGDDPALAALRRADDTH